MLLSYDLALDPDPPQTGRPCLLRLTVRAAAPAFCRKITLSLPTGTGAAHFTNAPAAITPRPVQGGEDADQGGGWRLTRADAADAVTFTALPTRPRGWLLGVTPLTLELAGVTANTTPGTATLRIEEETSSDGLTWQTQTMELPLPKFPDGFFFGDLRPELLMVPNGGHAELTWRGSPAVYTLTWAGEHGGSGGQADVSDVTTWLSPPLHDTTAFRLAARLPGSTAERVLTTLVTVALPHLRTHDLTATGKVRLIGAGHSIEIGRERPHTFQSDTDGLLIGRVQAVAGATPAQMEVTALADGGGQEYRAVFTSDNADPSKIPAETPFDVPVRRGTAITITCRYTRPPDGPEPIEPFFSLLWLPYGSTNRIM
ncbi:hypothetical protein ACFQVD_00115 [Streptosporangium amethystogenes subsp. fukuiense]|uniref:Ig-like domain-containing protein n=1 Tax=Streptosporangium amethystogenes subsp. fukuiense TaxID=698418 RepID=A0ABW2SSS5_9ACTN